MLKVIKHWHMLHRGVLDAPSLVGLDSEQPDLVNMSLLTSGWVGVDDHRHSLTKAFYSSAILSLNIRMLCEQLYMMRLPAAEGDWIQ